MFLLRYISYLKNYKYLVTFITDGVNFGTHSENVINVFAVQQNSKGFDPRR